MLTKNTTSTNFSNITSRFSLISVLFLISLIYFYHPLTNSFPLGYAGMFTQMAQQIADDGFALPMEVPHYGPGSIPFVYPPFALYLFALAIKIGFPVWAYLRLVPAALSLIALVPLYYFVREMGSNKFGALITLIVVATMPPVFYTHVWSAGIVRGIALTLCYTGLLFYFLSINEKEANWSTLILAGTSLGVLLATHLLYTVFAAVAGLALLLPLLSIDRIKKSIIIFGIAAIVSSPWLITIIMRHGFENLQAAASSHRNVDIYIFLTQDLAAAVEFLAGNLSHITDNIPLTVLSACGLLVLVLQRKFQLPLMLFFVLFMGEASFYSVIIAGIMAGFFAGWVAEKVTILEMPHKKIIQVIASLIFISLIVVLVGANISTIFSYEPEINIFSILMSDFVRGNTPATHTYLYIGKINEAEWFPYLLDRTPVFAPWGSEWKGTYAEQLNILIDLRSCQNNKDWGCIEAIVHKENASPDLLIVPNQRWLKEEIGDTNVWNLIYTDERYQVWEKVGE